MNAPVPHADPVVEVRGIRTRFGAALVHEHVDLDVHAGEIFALVGGSGSGKSTLLREIILLQPPDAGSIRALSHFIEPVRKHRSGSTPMNSNRPAYASSCTAANASLPNVGARNRRALR